MMTYEQFRDACDRLYAHASGVCSCATGLAANPSELRRELAKYLSYYASSASSRRTLWALVATELFLSSDAVHMGYGVTDVVAFAEWLADEGWLEVVDG